MPKLSAWKAFDKTLNNALVEIPEEILRGEANAKWCHKSCAF